MANAPTKVMTNTEEILDVADDGGFFRASRFRILDPPAPFDSNGADCTGEVGYGNGRVVEDMEKLVGHGALKIRNEIQMATTAISTTPDYRLSHCRHCWTRPAAVLLFAIAVPSLFFYTVKHDTCVSCLTE